jgi:hypothetical protein
MISWNRIRDALYRGNRNPQKLAVRLVSATRFTDKTNSAILITFPAGHHSLVLRTSSANRETDRALTRNEDREL